MLLHDFFTKKIKLTEATAKEKAAWVAQVTPAVEYAARQLGIDPRFIMDQWALETGYKIPANNNLGGLTNRGEESGFREYSNIQDYAKDWVNQINKNFPKVKGAETMDDYVDALQKEGILGVYAKEEPNTPTYRERLAGMRTGYKPSEEIMTAVAGQNVSPQAQAFTPTPAVDANQNAIDILQKEFQSAMKRGDGKAMNDILASVKGLGGDTAVQQVAQGTVEPSDARTAQAFTPPEEEKSYAEMGKDALPDSLSVKRKELEDAKAQGASQAEIDRLEQAVQYNLDVQAGKDVVGGVGTLTKDETDYLKAKQGALMQGKDDVTSIADDDLNRRRAEAYANQQEGIGNTEVADFARAEAKRHEALRNQKLTKGITWGQGTLDQQEQQMKQWDKTKSEGGNPAQSWSGGTITDPDKLKDWQRRNTEADKLQKEKGQWDITKTIDDYRADVSSWGQEVQKAEAEKEPAIPPATTTTTIPPATTTTTIPPAQAYSPDTTTTGGAVKQGSGYGQGGVQKTATPKVDPYPNPGYTGEELRIYNQLSDGQKAKITTDFEKSKNNTAQLRKNITPRTGPTSYPDAKPRSLLDIKHQQTLSKIEGGKVLVDPAQARDVSKALGMRNLNSTEQKARDAAIAGLRFTAPSLQDIQKGMTPIVDKSTQYKSDQNANAYDGKIGDAYRTLSEPKVEPVKPVTTGSKQTVGKPVPVKETRDFENWADDITAIVESVVTEAQFDEAAGEKDACYHKVKSRYKVWPSAYASGALVQCRKKGADNWGNSKKKSNENVEMDSKLDVDKLLTRLRNSKTTNSDRLADAIEMRFMHNMTFREIGEELNVGPSRAAMIIDKALRLLRWHATEFKSLE